MLKKEVLTFNEAAIYLEVSHSHLYKMTSTGVIPIVQAQREKIVFQPQGTG